MKLRPVTVAAWLSLATAGVAFAGGTAASMQLSVVRFSPSLISMLAFSVVGAFVVTYRPGNRIGWLFCAIGLFWQVFWLSVTSAERPLAAGTLDVLDPLIWLPVNFWYVSTVLLEIRQQLKWFSYASLVFVGVFGALVLANAFPVIRTIDPAGRYPADLFGGVPFALALLLIPLSLGLAILRYRLYDIDVLIKRTVVYAASTLVSFALFRPIRRRVRDAWTGASTVRGTTPPVRSTLPRTSSETRSTSQQCARTWWPLPVPRCRPPIPAFGSGNTWNRQLRFRAPTSP